MTNANRGKVAESHVAAYLKAYDAKHQEFDWHRVYDAHSAGGRFNRQVYDYAFFAPNAHGGIEVKEVKHGYRVPHGNFGPDQVAKLWKRQLAGGTIIILVYHSTTGAWRIVDLAVFRTREGGSWDLRDIPSYLSCREALDSTRVFV